MFSVYRLEIYRLEIYRLGKRRLKIYRLQDTGPKMQTRKIQAFAIQARARIATPLKVGGFYNSEKVTNCDASSLRALSDTHDSRL